MKMKITMQSYTENKTDNKIGDESYDDILVADIS